MRHTTADRRRLGVSQSVTYGVNLCEIDTKAFANLFEQAGQRFSALTVFIRRMWAIKNSINSTARLGQGFVHFVVHLVQCGDIKQATPQAGLVGGNDHTPACMVEFGNGINRTRQCLSLISRLDVRLL